MQILQRRKDPSLNCGLQVHHLLLCETLESPGSVLGELDHFLSDSKWALKLAVLLQVPVPHPATCLLVLESFFQEFPESSVLSHWIVQEQQEDF